VSSRIRGARVVGILVGRLVGIVASGPRQNLTPEECTSMSLRNPNSSRGATSDAARHARVGPLARAAAWPRGADAPSTAGAALDDVVPEPGDAGRPNGGPGALFIAVVHAIDTVHFVAASTTRGELLRQLADYTWRRGQHALWADDVARLRALLADGASEAAIAHYFAAVGQRWDAEWLVTARVGAGTLVVDVLAPEHSGATGRWTVPVARDWPTPEPCASASPPSAAVDVDR
jgi:hypothetical protein